MPKLLYEASREHSKEKKAYEKMLADPDGGDLEMLEGNADEDL